jgi:hypothetical protein
MTDPRTESALQAAAGPVAAFLEGIVVYALSQQWDDLLSAYLFRLQPIPYCSRQTLHCDDPAPAAQQFRYVAGLLAVAAFLLCYAEVGPLPYQWHVWRTRSFMRIGPRMIGMCIGWALGDACKAGFLIQIETKSRGGIGVTAASVESYNLIFAVLATLVTAIAMLVCQPIAAGRLGCGANALTVALSCYVRQCVLLLVNGLSVMVKIVWTFSFKGFLTWGIDAAQQDTALFQRALVLWAVSLTTVGAALTVLLRRWREQLDSAGSGDSEGGESTGAASERAWRRASERRRPAWHALCAQYMEIMEGTFGWVVGCAWTDAIVAYTPLRENTIERPAIAAADVAFASGFTLLGVGWLVLSGQRLSGGVLPRGGPAAEVARSQVEAAFTTNAFVFFVGWAWVVVLRDCTALVFACVSALTGGAKLASFIAEACAAALIGPLLTWAVMWAQGMALFDLIENTLRGRRDGDVGAGQTAGPLFLL